MINKGGQMIFPGAWGGERFSPREELEHELEQELREDDEVQPCCP